MNKLVIFSCLLLVLSSSIPEKKKKKFDAVITFHTQFGDMKALLYDDTPKHKENFIKLAEEGYYDSTTFHRVISGFMIQGGDPNSKDANPMNDGLGGPGYTIPAEIQHKHKKGALAAARKGDAVNPNRESSGSQFYIVHSEQGTQHLNGQYTVFGEVVSGLAIVDSIASVEMSRSSVPKQPIYMTIDVEWVKKKKITKEFNFSYE